jgi:phospholipase/lecithinase/hemolysin
MIKVIRPVPSGAIPARQTRGSINSGRYDSSKAPADNLPMKLENRRWSFPSTLAGRALLLGSLLVTATFTSTYAAPTDRQPVKAAYSAVYVLGDSLSDTGRMASVLGDDAPISCVNGRMSNGPLYIEHVSAALGIPYNSVNNFAWAGAYAGYGNAFTGLPGILDELDEFMDIYGQRPHIDKDALYIVFGGANDFIKILGGADPFVVIPGAVNNLGAIVTTLHDAGARHIVVMDLPNIGLTPRARLANAVVSCTFLTSYFNELLADKLDSLNFNVIRVSTFNVLNAVAANPAAYGITNITDIGAYDPYNSMSYLFWDDIHPTATMHAILAGEVLNALRAAVTQQGLPWRGNQGYFWSHAPLSN